MGIGGRGLHHDAGAHGFAESKEMFGVSVRFESVDDGASVIAFEPAVGGDGTAAGAVGAGVHHDNAVSGAQQEFRLTDDSHAVVRDAVEEEDPIPIGIFRADFPATEKHSIRSANLEILAACPSDGERGICFADEVRSQLAANGMEERRAGEPTGHSRQERWEEQQNQSDAYETVAHKGLCKDTRF